MYDVQFIIIVRPINQYITCSPSNSKLVEQTWVYMTVVMLLLLLWCSVVIGYCNCSSTVVVTKLLSLLLSTNQSTLFTY